jgi:hypothetical protein
MAKFHRASFPPPSKIVGSAIGFVIIHAVGGSMVRPYLAAIRMTTRAQNGPQSADRWLTCVNRQLSVESSLVGGPRFAAGDIGG